VDPQSRPAAASRARAPGPAGKEDLKVDFEFSEEQYEFLEQVDRFLEENYDPEVMDPSRENMSQLVDTPKRRAFMKKIGERGWLGMTWPKKYGGSEGEGVYEYLLNERLAGAGCPQIGKGVGIIGKTLIRHGSEKLKQEFLPQILQNDIEFAVGYSEPQAGSDAAAMALKATRDGDGWRLNGQKASQRSEDLHHLGALRRVELVRCADRSRCSQAQGDHALPDADE
jgi:alkylation response protein AidB-like acyl-CoA dehydrogenase